VMGMSIGYFLCLELWQTECCGSLMKSDMLCELETRIIKVVFCVCVCVFCSASTDGQVIVRNIIEESTAEGRTILPNVIAAVQFVNDGGACQPCLCWHSHNQVLVQFTPVISLYLNIAKVLSRAFSARMLCLFLSLTLL
jgi:hypothetical protein